MQVNSTGLYLKFSVEDIRSLLKMGENIGIKILERLDNNNYLIRVKGKTLKAYSNIEFKKGDTPTLIVEKTKPYVMLRFTARAAKDFIGTKNIKITIKKIDIKQLKASRGGDSFRNGLSEVKSIADNIKKAAVMFKDAAASLKAEQGSFFIQIPAEIASYKQNRAKTETVYLREEKEEKDKGKGVRVVLYVSPDKLGDLKIDMLYNNKKMYCSLFCADEKGFGVLSANKTQIEDMLGKNVKLSVGILKNNPVFLRKQIDIKI